MALTRIILGRIALGVLTLVLASAVVFLATQALPGDAARAVLGRTATPEALAELRSQLGLNEPVVVQYVGWLGRMAQGNFGTSLVGTREPVSEVLGVRLVNSFVLVFLSAIVSIPISLALGAYSALKRDSLTDQSINTATLSIAALPEFVVGIALILLFSTQVFHWAPAVSRLDPTQSIWSQLDLLILPIITLTIAVQPYITRMMRASTIEVLESDYVSMARLKGGPERVIMRRHVVPNAIVPAIQGTAIQLAWLAGGIVVVEYLFAYPGIGGSLVEAVDSRDLPVIQALTLIIGAVYVLTNLAADIITILVSPRLRTGLR